MSTEDPLQINVVIIGTGKIKGTCKIENWVLKRPCRVFPDSKAVATTLFINCFKFTEFEICSISDLKKHCQFEGLPGFVAE